MFLLLARLIKKLNKWASGRLTYFSFPTSFFARMDYFSLLQLSLYHSHSLSLSLALSVFFSFFCKAWEHLSQSQGSFVSTLKLAPKHLLQRHLLQRHLLQRQSRKGEYFVCVGDPPNDQGLKIATFVRGTKWLNNHLKHKQDCLFLQLRI